MKYRKKPVVIEAFQITSNACYRILKEKTLTTDMFWPDWLLLAWKKHYTEKNAFFINETPDGTKDLYISTLEGWHKVSTNDWIIKGVKGELYPCKPEIFKLTYEPVNN